MLFASMLAVNSWNIRRNVYLKKWKVYQLPFNLLLIRAHAGSPFTIVCLLFVGLSVIYLFEQVEVLAAIKQMWTCYTHPYTHKGQPQHTTLLE